MFGIPLNTWCTTSYIHGTRLRNKTLAALLYIEVLDTLLPIFARNRVLSLLDFTMDSAVSAVHLPVWGGATLMRAIPRGIPACSLIRT